MKLVNENDVRLMVEKALKEIIGDKNEVTKTVEIEE